jgi:hypothetical protein
MNQDNPIDDSDKCETPKLDHLAELLDQHGFEKEAVEVMKMAEGGNKRQALIRKSMNILRKIFRSPKGT